MKIDECNSSEQKATTFNLYIYQTMKTLHRLEATNDLSVFQQMSSGCSSHSCCKEDHKTVVELLRDNIKGVIEFKESS